MSNITNGSIYILYIYIYIGSPFSFKHCVFHIYFLNLDAIESYAWVRCVFHFRSFFMLRMQTQCFNYCFYYIVWFGCRHDFFQFIFRFIQMMSMQAFSVSLGESSDVFIVIFVILRIWIQTHLCEYLILFVLTISMPTP